MKKTSAKKLLLVLTVILAAAMLFAACKAGYKDGGGGLEPIEGEQGLASDTRKIIYSASMTISCDNVADALAVVKGSLKADEWVAFENTSETYCNIVVRVKSGRLEEFREAVSKAGSVGNYNLSSKDITQSYYDTKSKIEAMEIERDALNEMMKRPDLTIADTITLSDRISTINAQLQALSQTLSAYDGLIDYSEVTIYINGKEASKPFGQQLLGVITGAWNAFVAFLKFLLYAVIVIMIFSIIGIPAGIIIPYSVKRRKKRQALKPDAAGQADTIMNIINTEPISDDRNANITETQ